MVWTSIQENTPTTPKTPVEQQRPEPNWRRISCEDASEQMEMMDPHIKVYSKNDDLWGDRGEPRLETVYCRDDAPTEPILKGVRWPVAGGDGADLAPCEHYLAR